MSSDPKVLIDSMRKMEKGLRGAVGKLAGDEQRMLLAALNPIFALEEAGYSFTDEIRAGVERRVRFAPSVYDRAEALLREINALAGRVVDPNSAQDLDKLLFSELKLPRPVSSLRAQLPAGEHFLLATDLPTERLLPQLPWTTKTADPLEELRSAHRVMPPLLEFRQIDASTPRLATREVYEKFRNGEIKTSIHNLTVTVQPHPPGH
jgi:hypothetical protein